jgi:hypothetical protein
MTAENVNSAMDRGQAAIDAALRSVGSATPAAGFEGRILTRLASERIRMESSSAHHPLFARLGVFPARALGLVTACLLGFVVVAGSVSYSHHIKPSTTGVPPSLVLPGQGIGAASAVHPAAPASTPAPPGQAGRSARRSGPGRARIAPHSRKAPGVAIPPPSNKPPSDSQN